MPYYTLKSLSVGLEPTGACLQRQPSSFEDDLVDTEGFEPYLGYCKYPALPVELPAHIYKIDLNACSAGCPFCNKERICSLLLFNKAICSGVNSF